MTLGWCPNARLRRARRNRDIEPSLAKRVAEGDACPISLLPMEDINPGYVPRALKPIPTNRRHTCASGSPGAAATPVARPDKGKGRAKEPPPEKPSNVGLHKFFCKSALRCSIQIDQMADCGRQCVARASRVLPFSLLASLYVCGLLPP